LIPKGKVPEELGISMVVKVYEAAWRGARLLSKKLNIKSAQRYGRTIVNPPWV
jgi:hypothetical protein